MVFATREWPSCSENQGLDLISDKYKMRFGIDLVPQDKTEQSVLAYRIATDSKLCSEVTTVKTRAPANSQTLQAQNTCAPPTSANWARSRTNTRTKHTWARGVKKKKAAPTASATATRWDPSHTETQHKRLHTRNAHTNIIQGNGSEEAADDSPIVCVHVCLCACALAIKHKYIILWVHWKWRGGNTRGVIVDPGWLIPSGSRRRLSAKAK